MIKYKYSKLTEEMKINKATQRHLSEILGISDVSFRKKLAGTTDWTISEIEALCDYFKRDYYELFGKE